MKISKILTNEISVIWADQAVIALAVICLAAKEVSMGGLFSFFASGIEFVPSNSGDSAP